MGLEKYTDLASEFTPESPGQPVQETGFSTLDPQETYITPAAAGYLATEAATPQVYEPSEEVIEGQRVDAEPVGMLPLGAAEHDGPPRETPHTTDAPAEAAAEPLSPVYTVWSTGSFYAVNDPVTLHDIPMVTDIEPPPEGVDTVSIVFNGEDVAVSASVLKTVAEFVGNAHRHDPYGHDCAIFAHAYMTGESFRDIPREKTTGMMYYRSRSYVEPLDEIVAEKYDEDLPAGTVLALSNATDADHFYNGTNHFFVKATPPGVPALYFSKLGISNPIVLTDLDTLLTLYDAQQLGIVDSMSPQPDTAPQETEEE